MKKIISISIAAFILAGTIPVFASNPITGKTSSGNLIYTGDPAALVDGDTVYLYTGHDTSTNSGYKIPEWTCWSSKNLTDWKYEGVPLAPSSLDWATNNEAWAGQVVKRNGKYYYYTCAGSSNSSVWGNGKHVGVAVSDSPTGPFTDIGHPLVYNQQTAGAHNYDDIDPTAWIETGEDGVERAYLCWGNTNCYIAELNDDMISIKDQNGDGSITQGVDIMNVTINNLESPLYYTEAPWLYRRQDENGNYYGKYYLFFAAGWYERMAYATADNIYGPYEYQGTVMEAGASSNTNHMSVIDFKGKTYFIYHTGALPNGSGYRRTVCIDELYFDDDGRVIPLEESSVGLDGTAYALESAAQPGKYVHHEHFENGTADSDYPMSASVSAARLGGYGPDYKWEIIDGRYSGTNYVSIQSVNKMGYFLTESGGKIKLLHDDSGTDAVKKTMTFKQISGLSGEGVSFESVSAPGKYLANIDGEITLSDGSDKAAATFILTDADVTGVTLDGDFSAMEAGEERAFTAYVNENAANKGITAYSTDTSVLEITDVQYNFVTQKTEITVKALKNGGATLKIYTDERRFESDQEITIGKKVAADVTIEKDMGSINVSTGKTVFLVVLKVTDPDGKTEHIELLRGGNTYSYTPKKSGLYKITAGSKTVEIEF